MTNPGHWTADGKPQTKTARTWWIVGGVILAALVVAAAFLAGLGWEDATAPKSEPASLTSSEVAATLTACDNHDKRCHIRNNTAVEKLQGALGADAPADIASGVRDFRTQFQSFTNGNCGINKKNVVCGLNGLNMNLAVSSIKTAVASG